MTTARIRLDRRHTVRRGSPKSGSTIVAARTRDSRPRCRNFAVAGCAAVALALAVVATAQSAEPVLRLGSRGALVEDWQRILNTVGGHLTEDGVFGPATAEATRQFQRQSQLRATGVVGTETWVRWIGANVTCCGAGLPNFGSSFGTEPNAYVAWWQLALHRWFTQRRLPDIVIDGVYGNATRSKTTLFQTKTGLRPTGIADRATWKRMQHQGDDLQLP